QRVKITPHPSRAYNSSVPILIVSINHADQIAPIKDELSISEVMEKKERVRALVAEAISQRTVDLICEESDPRHLSIAQELAFNHKARIPWTNIYMTSQERLEAGIWEQLLYRPFEIDHEKEITIESRVPQDDVRETFFRDE